MIEKVIFKMAKSAIENTPKVRPTGRIWFPYMVRYIVKWWI